MLVAAFSIENLQRCKLICFEVCFFDVRHVFARRVSRYPSAESNLWCGLNVNGLVLNGIRHLLELCIWRFCISGSVFSLALLTRIFFFF